MLSYTEQNPTPDKVNLGWLSSVEGQEKIDNTKHGGSKETNQMREKKKDFRLEPARLPFALP